MNREDIARKIHSLTGGRLMFGTIIVGRVEVVCDTDSIMVAPRGWGFAEVLPKGLTFRQIATHIEAAAHGQTSTIGAVVTAQN